MFSKILYPTDFSKEAEKALNYVKKLKDAGCREVVILHVVDVAVVEAYEDAFVWAGKDVEEETKKLDEALIEKAKAKLKAIAEELEREGLKVKVVVKIGSPWEVIVETAEDEKVSLILMGAHGCGRLGCAIEKLIGSTAENVIRHAKVPVMVVR